MTPERYQQIDGIFQAALGLERNEYAAYLDKVCGGDQELRCHVESLITSDEGGLSFIDEPAFEMAARILASDAPALTSGDHIDRYEVVSLLGSGGMGEVYLAHDEKLDRKIALKLLPSHFTANLEWLRRFQQEARAASALNHPNIITIHEIGTVEDCHFIATEFVDGDTLRERMRRGPLTLHESVDIAIQLCSALAAAHEVGIVHRDIKPENIMLRHDDYVKVLDFGLAKLAAQRERPHEIGAAENVNLSSGLVMGTIKYMSPEQAQGLEVDCRSDLFSLGIVFYEMLAGHAPYARESNRGTVDPLLSEKPEAIKNIPAQLQEIIDTTLQKDKSERYQTADELSMKLKSVRQLLRTRGWITKQRAAGILIALTITIAIVVGLKFARPSRSERIAPVRKSVAVLPFRSASKDPADDYLGPAIADVVINKLTGLREIIVRPLASVSKYSAYQQDPIAVGRELGVDVVIDGQIQRAGDTYSVSVQVWQISDGASLSSYTCDETCGKIAELENSVSERAATALAIRLTSQEQKYLAKRYTEDKAAYDRYLKGRYYFDKNTKDGFAKSAEYFKQAIDMDGSYAPAYAGLSDAYYQLAWSDSPASTELMVRAKIAANKALELDESLAEGHAAIGAVKLMYDWDWTGAQQEFERAIALKPNCIRALDIYAYGLVYVGQFDRAIEVSKAQLELDPLSVMSNFDLGGVYLCAHHTDEAINQLQSVIEMDPKMPVAHHFLLNAFYRKGLFNEFIEKLIAIRSDPVLSAGGDWSGIGLSPTEIREVYTKSGWEGFLRAELGSLMTRSKKEYVAPKRIAVLYAMLGENNQAMEWLEKTYQEHSKTIMTIKVDPRLDRLQSDSRFQEMLRRVGLSQ